MTEGTEIPKERKSRRGRPTVAKEQPNCPLEKKEHLWFMDWVRLNHWLKERTHHSPNEGKRTHGNGYVLKKMGMSPGFPDFFFYIPNGRYSGLAIELKRKTNYVISREQQAWIDRLNSDGYFATFAFGWEHAKMFVDNYLREYDLWRRREKKW